MVKWAFAPVAYLAFVAIVYNRGLGAKVFILPVLLYIFLTHRSLLPLSLNHVASAPKIRPPIERRELRNPFFVSASLQKKGFFYRARRFKPPGFPIIYYCR
jgi:hypothetical protein